MSNTSIKLALVNLLPTHENALPPELLNLAQSILTQSRSYVNPSSLKPEEEIARPYACAEIACKRSVEVLSEPSITNWHCFEVADALQARTGSPTPSSTRSPSMPSTPL
jgi:hypothetical protein